MQNFSVELSFSECIDICSLIGARLKYIDSRLSGPGLGIQEKEALYEECKYYRSLKKKFDFAPIR